MLRDFRADAPLLNLNELRKTSHPDYSDSLFLPSTKDYESPSDPTGEKGMKEWVETHQPREGNTKAKAPGRTARQGA